MFLAKHFILDTWQGSEYAYESIRNVKREPMTVSECWTSQIEIADILDSSHTV